MQRLYYELEILSRAVHYKNLSAAAVHVGLSQPQLSRIIGKIEEEMKIVLLDRTAKRKSAWTAVAMSLAQTFDKNMGRMLSDIANLTQETVVSELKIGTLEGLTSIAMKVAQQAFKEIGIKQISLDVLDLNDLESHFTTEHLDLIFTSKFPSRSKFKHALQIGYQDIDMIKTKPDIGVFSTFEFGRLGRKNLETFDNVFISNSLFVRKQWFKDMGGTGSLPSDMKKGTPKDKEPVYAIATDLMSLSLWEKLEKLLLKL